VTMGHRAAETTGEAERCYGNSVLMILMSAHISSLTWHIYLFGIVLCGLIDDLGFEVVQLPLYVSRHLAFPHVTARLPSSARSPGQDEAKLVFRLKSEH
jgi:hypothetical protein